MGVKLGFVGDTLSAIKHYTNFNSKVPTYLTHFMNFNLQLSSQIWIDNFVFRLHSQVTVLFLFGSCIIVSIGQFFGDPIDCLVDVSI